MKNRYGVDVFENVFNTCIENVIKTWFEDILKMFWRQTKCLLGISVSSKFKYVPNKSISHKSMSDESNTNPRCLDKKPIISLFISF